MISIITSAYNAELTLAQTIRSVLSQSCHNIEYLIVDHGSSDSTRQIIDQFAAQDCRIRHLTIETNTGYIGRALNYALQFAKGEYVAFLDADDTYEPAFLDMMLANIERDHLDLAVCGFHRVNEHNKIIRTDTIGSSFLVSGPNGYNELWKQFLTASFGYLYVWWNKLYRRSFLDKNHLQFPEDSYVHGDALFQAELLAHMPRMYCSSDALVNWRCVLGSSSYGTYKKGYYKEAADAAWAFSKLTERFLFDQDMQKSCCERLLFSLPHLQRLRYYQGTLLEQCSELIDWITYPSYWNLVTKSGAQAKINQYLKDHLQAKLEAI